MDKIRKVLELIDNPGEYSPEEMEGILSDPEMRRLYDTLSATSGALTWTGKALIENGDGSARVIAALCGTPCGISAARP